MNRSRAGPDWSESKDQCPPSALKETKALILAISEISKEVGRSGSILSIHEA